MANSDKVLRGRVLTTCYQLRHANGGRVPITDITFGGLEPVTPDQVVTICEQLDEAELIKFEALRGQTLTIGHAKITGHGVDVVEGTAIPRIAIETSPSTSTPQPPATDSIADIPQTRIANWERYGVDAIEADLKYNGGIRYVGGPPGTNEQAWRWVRFKKLEAATSAISVPSREVTGWPRVDRAIAEATTRLQSAQSEEQFQAIGLICREVLISAAQTVFNPAVHPTIDGVAASSTDAKRMLDAYITHEMGNRSAESRQHAKSSVSLALSLQHKRTAVFRDAAACLEATSSVINQLAILSGVRDPKGSADK